MTDDDKEFSFSYSAPTESERREIERIRREYSGGDATVEDLRRLDKKVKAPATAASVMCGVIGTLVFGTGLAMVLSWNMTVAGAAVSLVGAVVAACAYGVYNFVLGLRRKKYAAKILALSEKLLSAKEDGQDKISLTK